MNKLHTRSGSSFKMIQLFPHDQTTKIPNSQRIHQYHQLLRMKKLLADTQQKMQNRINLFKKASQKILKKRQNEFKIITRIQSIKSNQGYRQKSQDQFISRVFTGTSQGRRMKQNKNNDVQQQNKFIGQKMIQDRIDKAKAIKQQKQRFKEQRKKIDLQRKLKSASGIRQRRNNVKMMKEKYQNQKKQEFIKLMNEKYQKQREEFIHMEKHLSELQIEQSRALLAWKKTMCENNIQEFTYQN